MTKNDTIDLVKHKGDFLIFAALASIVCPKKISPADMYSLLKCDKGDGVYVRHPELKEHESRSDISKDGYLGVIFMEVFLGRAEKIEKIIRGGWKRKWTMGKRGSFDYVNIWPLIPLLYAAKYPDKFPILIPPAFLFKFGKASVGHRAHFFSLIIMILMKLGYKKSRFTSILEFFMAKNPDNQWFAALYLKSLDCPINDLGLEPYKLPENQHHGYGWGSCPNEVLNGLIELTKKL